MKGTSPEDIVQLEKARREKVSAKVLSSYHLAPVKQDENQCVHKNATKSMHLGTALRENIDTQARQRSSMKKSASKDSGAVSPFSKTNVARNVLCDKKILGSQGEPLKIKRQISFDI